MKTAFVEGEIFPAKTPFAARVAISVVAVVVAVKGEVLLGTGDTCLFLIHHVIIILSFVM